MTIRKRLFLLSLLFAAASVFFLAVASPPIARDYAVLPVAAVYMDEEPNGEPAPETSPFAFESFTELPPLSGRIGRSMVVISGGEVRTAGVGDHYALGSGSASVSDGENFHIEAAGGSLSGGNVERVWLGGTRGLLLSDDGRRYADISETIRSLSGARTLEDPQFRHAKAPLSAAASVGDQTVIADILGNLFLAAEGEDPHSIASPFDGRIAVALRGRHRESGPHDYYIFALVSGNPASLTRLTIDGANEPDRAAEPAEIVERRLNRGVDTPAVIEQSDRHVALGVGRELKLYDVDLDKIGRYEANAEIREIAFDSDGDLIFLRSSLGDVEQLSVLHTEDFHPAYTLDFPSALDSFEVVTRDGYTFFAVGIGSGLTVYREGLR